MRRSPVPLPIALDDPRLKPHAPISDGKPWFEIHNEGDGSAVEVLIYGTIGDSWFYEGVSAADFKRQLDAIDADEITVRIHSQGGSVFEGIAILNTLRQHKAKITTIVDGLAASAASFIAMAGDEIVMCANTEMMIHDASSVSIGNAADMREMAELLDKVSDNIAGIYAGRAGGTVKQWRARMTDETWYLDTEAVAAGLADRVDKGNSTKADKGAKNFDLSVFNYAGRRAAPRPDLTVNSPANRGRGHKEGDSQMGQTLKSVIAKSVGLSADASDEDLLKKLTETEVDEDETTAPAGDPAPSGDPDPATPDPAETTDPAADPSGEPKPENRGGAPEGTVVVDAERFAALEANSKRFEEHLAAQAKAADKAFINEALAAGKIPSQRREHWENLLSKDPGIRDVINAMPAGSAAPVGEVGHGMDGSPDAGTASGLSTAEDIRKSDIYTNWSK